MHGAKHPFLPVPLWEVAQLNPETNLRSPYIFSKNSISSKTRNIVLIMGVLAFMIKWWTQTLVKGFTTGLSDRQWGLITDTSEYEEDIRTPVLRG
jgi:hypothetical protein